MHSLTNEEIRKQIIEHYSNPINKGFIKSDKEMFVHRNLNNCDDNIKVQLIIKNDVVINARFEGNGCVISISSTDLICEAIKNKKLDNVMIIIENFDNMLHKKGYNSNILGNLIIFENISKQPNRIKCATIFTVPLKEKIQNEFK